jgi:hypothetical protein
MESSKLFAFNGLGRFNRFYQHPGRSTPTSGNSFRAAKKAPCHNRGLSVDNCSLSAVMMVTMVAMMALGVRRND